MALGLTELQTPKGHGTWDAGVQGWERGGVHRKWGWLDRGSGGWRVPGWGLGPPRLAPKGGARTWGTGHPFSWLVGGIADSSPWLEG